MKNDSETHGTFELHFQNWERNRMYPPKHGKECVMKKPTYHHINAITHAEHLLKPLLKQHQNDKYKTDLKNDIKYLQEARTILQFALVHPHLPFPEYPYDEKQPTPATEKVPMFNKLIDAVCEEG